MTSIQFAKHCTELALEKKALDPVILDLRKVDGPCEFFVIVSAESEPQLKAITTMIVMDNKEKLDRRPLAVDGSPSTKWTVVDYGDVMIHIFHAERRPFYGLETLWKDATRVKR